MKLKNLYLALALGAAAVLALPVSAGATSQHSQDFPRSVGEVVAKMKPMELMHMIDKEKKGVVTKEQYMQFFEDLWNKMDPNHTGTVDKDTWMHGWAQRNQ